MDPSHWHQVLIEWMLNNLMMIDAIIEVKVAQTYFKLLLKLSNMLREPLLLWCQIYSLLGFDQGITKVRGNEILGFERSWSLNNWEVDGID